MKVKLELALNNSDSHETDRRTIEVEINNDRVIAMGWVCESRPTEESFTTFLRALYGNPNCDLPKADDSQLGVAYHEIWDNLSRYAYDELGWHDVTVDVLGLYIDGEETKLAKLLDVGMVDGAPFALQMSRDGFMYCYN